LADFGLARIADVGGTMTICGTPSWIAPEVFEGSHYDKTIDVYSFSIVM
jgi:serine/threonine protein kinase